ncbi:MAG: histidine phosphatase family protein [Erysipelotrichaceae bacterium]|nr:histidine phosphatase family protein [Erysipelotrichaceae bacterium]
MKKYLYLMRHGETLFNVKRRIQGSCDSPLTENGINQAKKASRYFEAIELDYAYSSTAERSADTLEIVTKNSMPYTRMKGLKERNFGIFEGESEDIHLRKHFETIYGEYGGETVFEVKERMVNTLTEIMEKDNHNTVLAVSHAGACRSFLAVWENPEGYLKSGVPNCCIFKYEYNDRSFKLIDIIDPNTFAD